MSIICSDWFNIKHVKQQGCPLFPLLFALRVEPLANIIRPLNMFTDITIGRQEYCISLFADNIPYNPLNFCMLYNKFYIILFQFLDYKLIKQNLRYILYT